MKTLTVLAVSCSLLGGAACSSMSAGPTDSLQIFDTTLADAQNNRATAMTAQRTALKAASGKAISTCTDYLSQSADMDWMANPDNAAALPDYAVCDSLAVLENAKPATVPGAAWGEKLGSKLDFRSFRSSLYQQTSDDKYTLKQLAGEPLQIDAYSAALDNAEWFLKVQLVAVGDFNGDGRADGLLWLTDQAKEGTYLSVQTLVVDDIAATGTLKAQPAR